MAISFVNAGAVATGTTSVAVPYPASPAAGNLLVLLVANKYPTNGPATPGAFFAPSGNQYSRGGGTPGVDTGDVYITVFLRIADGTETGSETVTLTGANTSIARMFQYSKSASMSWNYACAGGSDNTAGTAWSVTAGSNPGVTANDMVLVGSGICGNTDTATAEAITQTGVTFGTMVEQQDSGSNGGDDISLWMTEHPVSSGTGSAAPVYTATVAGTGSANAAGASLFLRLREVPADVTITCTAGSLASAGVAAGVQPGAVTIQSNLGGLAGQGRAATISAPPAGLTVPCVAGVLASAGVAATVQPGAVTVQAGLGAVAGAGPVAAVQPGPVTIQSNAAVLAGAGQSASVSSPPPGLVVNCQVVALAGAGRAATVLPGGVTVPIQAGTLLGAGQAAAVQPGGVTIQSATAALVGAGWPAVVSTTAAGVTVQASAGALAASGQTAAVQPGPVSVTTGIGALSLTGPSATVSAGVEAGGGWLLHSHRRAGSLAATDALAGLMLVTET